MFFDNERYDLLSELIPDKSYTNIYNQYIVGLSNDNKKNNIFKQIKELSELKNEGILTEMEFEEKKKELLSRI